MLSLLNSLNSDFVNELQGLPEQVCCPYLAIVLSQWFFPSLQFSSVAQACPTLCDPMNHSMPGLPVHHQLLESTQTHVHWVGDAIQPSHPLFPSLLFPHSVFPSIRVFSNESALRIKWPKYWSFSFSISLSNKYSEMISFRMDWFDLLAVQGTLYRVFSSNTIHGME